MKRAYSVWCEFSHNEQSGKYQIETSAFMDRDGYIHVLLNACNAIRPYQYDNIADMIKFVVLELKRNNFYCKYYVQSGARFYEIWWRNKANTNGSWDRYGLSESYITEKHFPRVGKACKREKQ